MLNLKKKKPVQEEEPLEEGEEERKKGDDEEQELEPIVIRFNNMVLQDNRVLKQELDKQKKYAINSLTDNIRKRLSYLKDLKNKDGLSAGAEQFIDKNIVILENGLTKRLNPPTTNSQLLSFIKSKGFELYVNTQYFKKKDSKPIYEMIMDGATRAEVRKAINSVYTKKTGREPGIVKKGFGLEKTDKIQLMVGSAMAGNNNKKLLRKIR